MRTKTCDVLVSIWQHLLKSTNIGIEDDFFKLGGNPKIASQLFIEIRDLLGRELPPETIFLAPTIKALGELVESPSPIQFGPLLPLKAGFNSPPILIAHGLAATVTELFDLATSLQTGHPVYGLQAKGLGEAEEPHSTVTDIANYYVKAIRNLQPHGPYVLVGFSLGGLVTLEMARQLKEDGESIALLAMLDSYPNWRDWPVGQQLKVFFRRLMRWSFRSMGLKDNVRLVANRAPRPSSPTSTSQKDRLSITDDRYLRYSQAMLSALRQYRPRAYGGSVKFVKAEMSSKFPDDVAAVWRPWLKQIEVRTVAGEHRAMITTEVGNLAAILNKYLEDAFAQVDVLNQR